MNKFKVGHIIRRGDNFWHITSASDSYYYLECLSDDAYSQIAIINQVDSVCELVTDMFEVE